MPKWSRRFFASLRRTRSVSAAATAAGVGRTTVYRHREEDPEFERRWEEALEMSLEDVEETVHSIAVNGVEEPLTFQGKLTGDKRRRMYPEHSRWWLEKLNPTKYGEKGEGSKKDIAQIVFYPSVDDVKTNAEAEAAEDGDDE